VSSEELISECYRRIDRQDPQIKAFLSLSDRDDLMVTAQRIDNARARKKPIGPLAGVPIAVKDNISVAGQPLTCGSRMLENYTTPYDATAIARTKSAGMLIVGKTNMDEFGFGSSTENSAFFPTCNPHSLDRVPGGTSGGSAAAVAAGMVSCALGTDTGGSVRQPSSLCGVVGIRPTYGRVSRYGLVAYASSMDQIGPIANTVDDAATVLAVIGGHDPLDSTSFPDSNFDKSRSLPRVRLGILRDSVDDGCELSVLEAMEKVASAATRLGWEVSTISLPMTKYSLAAYYLIASVEAASNLARYDGVKYGFRAPGGKTYEEMLIATRTLGFGAEAKRRILLGTYASSAGYQDKYYTRATLARRMISDQIDEAFTKIDIFVSPISPTTAWPLGERTADPMKMYLSDVFSVLAPLAGIPSLALPVGTDAEGLPVGVQVCGPRFEDDLVIRASRALESALLE